MLGHYLGSVLSKDANETVSVGLQTFVEETRTQVLRSVGNLEGKELEVMMFHQVLL